MADTKLSGLTALAGSGLASGDLWYLDDVSVPQSKSIRSDLALDGLLRVADVVVTTGTAILRRTGNVIGINNPAGTPGTAEMQLSHNGTNGIVQAMSGALILETAAAVGIQINNNTVIQTIGATQWNMNVAQTYAQAAQFSGLVTMASGFAGTSDVGWTRLAATVLKINDGTTGLGWLQTDGKKRVASNATNATATMSNLTDLSAPVVAARKYGGFLAVIAKNSTAAEGLQFDFGGGSATMTSFQATLVGTAIGTTLGTTTSSAIATAVTATVATTTDVTYLIYVTFVVNAGGTLIPRFAEVSHATGTATVELGSTLVLWDLP